MPITLTIVDRDQLPDGGPIKFSAGARGFDIGREQHLDWCLPDPERFVSGHHCQVRFRDGGYWLDDISTNGTFVNGSSIRVRSPYRLAHGDRLQIGNYQIEVSLDGQPSPGGIQSSSASPFSPEPAPFGQPAGQSPFAPASSPAAPVHDIWALPGAAAAPAPVDRNWFLEKARQDRGIRPPDALEQFIELPVAARPPIDELHPISPALGNLPGSSISEHAAPAITPPPARGGGSPEQVLALICQAAGLKPDAMAGRDPQEVAREIGLVLRTSTEQLATLLHGRADAKRIARSANRTMIGAADNNALKFTADATEALEIMFQRHRAGYLDAPASFKEAFADIQQHEKATFAAMQRALSRLTEDLTPDSIEEKVGGGFGSAKAKAWEIYVQRWNSKTEHLENGILDVFFGYFSEFYDAMGKKSE
ncbi:type VI secretion system-associated FHA domain protein TagH [Devosia sp. Root635]|uniref:type VI secretion system-associated FHA domain protein TagH n=1 Tax=Devosia sp. Root635 TaxID=1736575 RepID=UPI0006F7DBD8|nr:type VI secretion system-associated FHA domain protein TagH [Devosia sp. Root635]KRA53074.1 hypothetical protein ASD80_13865 [Devosia sp. Root635]